jgi:hypothetical protein
VSAAEALKAARAAGIEIGIDGDDLVLEASAPPSAAVLDLLSRHKAGIVTLLRPDRDGWSAEDWQVFFDQRAGNAEFDGGLPRPQAKARAFTRCIAEWLNRDRVRSPPGRCVGCGAGEQAHDPLLPFGTDPNNHAWLHSRCWPAWYAGRRAEAVRALAAAGIIPRRFARRFRKKRGRMMGGFGSGRPSGLGRGTVESCRSLDVNRLHKAGCLSLGWSGGWQWTRDGEKVAWISLRAGASCLNLTYRVRVAGGEWQDVEETVRIVRIPCRFGGARPYFICPGVVNGITCGQRAVKLHGAGRYFLCTHCYHLAHTSQSEGVWDRALRRANKIRQRLGGDPGMAAPFPEKPKGMWHRTYQRLRDKAFDAERLAEAAFETQADRLLARINSPKRKRSFWR